MTGPNRCYDCDAPIALDRGRCDECADERSRDLRGRRLRASGMPLALRGLRFDSIDETDRFQAVRAGHDFAAGRVGGLLLYGPVGTGKTRLAATAANARLLRERLLWVSVPALIANALAALDSDERKQATRALTGRQTLVLDDLDKVKPSEWVLAQLFVAIDSRVAQGVGLLVTTNLRPSEIAKRLGEPIASRLVGYCAVHEMAGRDRRLDQ